MKRPPERAPGRATRCPQCHARCGVRAGLCQRCARGRTEPRYLQVPGLSSLRDLITAAMRRP